MREILFRGKRKDNGEWVEGLLKIHLVDGDLTQKEKEYYITVQRMDEIGKVYRVDFEVIPETVGQYTGLTDKNGVKIFEGDIVQEEDMLSVCKFLCCVGSYAFVPIEMYKEDEEEVYLTSNFRKLYEIYEDSGTDLFFENDVPWKFVTVVGSIHDNPAEGDAE